MTKKRRKANHKTNRLKDEDLTGVVGGTGITSAASQCPQYIQDAITSMPTAQGQAQLAQMTYNNAMQQCKILRDMVTVDPSFQQVYDVNYDTAQFCLQHGATPPTPQAPPGLPPGMQWSI